MPKTVQKTLLLAALGFPLGFGAAPRAAGQVPDTEAPAAISSVSLDQKLGDTLPLDLRFRDETGKPVMLRDYFRDKPVLVNLVYYQCPMLCTLVLNGLTDALKSLAFTPGKEFEVVTVSFDARETPELAARKKDLYLKEYGREGAQQGWHFLTGDESSIAALTSAVGFRYRYDEATKQFAHASGIMIATPAGVLSHYLYGIEYPMRNLRLALVEASEGRIGNPVDRLLLFCYHYDPSTGEYTAAIMNFVRAGCLATVAVVSGFVGLMLRRDAKQRLISAKSDHA